MLTVALEILNHAYGRPLLFAALAADASKTRPQGNKAGTPPR